MSKDLNLEKLKEILSVETDEETAKDNFKLISEWEKGLTENAAYIKWQNNPVTQMISKKAQAAYQDASVQLAVDRNLTEDARNRLYATQDASLLILSWTDKDAKSTIVQLQEQIKHALRAVS